MEALCSCSPDIVDILLKDNVVHKLLKILGEPCLGTPTKLLVLKVGFQQESNCQKSAPVLDFFAFLNLVF